MDQRAADAGAVLECLIQHKNHDEMLPKCAAGIEHHQLVSCHLDAVTARFPTVVICSHFVVRKRVFGCFFHVCCHVEWMEIIYGGGKSDHPRLFMLWDLKIAISLFISLFLSLFSYFLIFYSFFICIFLSCFLFFHFFLFSLSYPSLIPLFSTYVPPSDPSPTPLCSLSSPPSAPSLLPLFSHLCSLSGQ